MQAEDVRSDEALRELVVRAFDNITGLSDQISEGYLSRFFNIFHLMYPAPNEAKKNPPKNASQNMRDLLENIGDEDGTQTALVWRNNDEVQKDSDEDYHRYFDNDNGAVDNDDGEESNDNFDDNDDNDNDGDEDEMVTKR